MSYSLDLQNITVTPTSLLTAGETELQVIAVSGTATHAGHVKVTCLRDGETVADGYDLAVCGGPNEWDIMLPPPKATAEGVFKFYDVMGTLLTEVRFAWDVPRHWIINVVIASHTDIGLHNSQYIQRYNSSKFVDQATGLMDETANRAPENQYRYMMEGTWFWNNYGEDKGREAAEKVADAYIRKGRLAVGCATAGNHTQVYGLEELCRSAYTKQWLKDDWKVDSSTMTMIDNNGISWSIIEPYVSAGIRNILFAPNQWNPLPSTVWRRDTSIPALQWNSDAGGGGTRVDVRYDSDVPMVFYWLGPDGKSKMLVWTSSSYGHGGLPFGLSPDIKYKWTTYEAAYQKIRRMLPKLERRYAFDRWLLASYSDDQVPDLSQTNFIMEWNKRWKSPQFVTVGNLDEPFDYLREHFDTQIPVLRGDITSGWCLHPLATPELLAQKFEIDRLLPQTEMLNVLAALGKPSCTVKRSKFEEAWEALLCNDEHSYGVSGYQGRRVYETWMQHRDWLETADAVAQMWPDMLRSLTTQLQPQGKGLLVFNPTLQSRSGEVVEVEGMRCQLPTIPPLAVAFVPNSEIAPAPNSGIAPTPNSGIAPAAQNRCLRVETDYYCIVFAEDGSIGSLYDKELRKELVDEDSPFRLNQFVYTADNNRSFVTPQKAVFTRCDNKYETIIVATTSEPLSEAELVTTVTIPHNKKEIAFDNQLRHVRGLYNKCRYNRYGYFAFPFNVDKPRFTASLNGCVARPHEDQTAHGTDTYLPVREWACVENDAYGVALMQLDSLVVEFGQIHKDKTDYGMPETSGGLYSYVCNDWLQMHTHSGEAISPRFRYKVTSYSGDWRTADIPAQAERYAMPLLVQPYDDGRDSTGAVMTTKSFVADVPDGIRLLAIKAAEDGDGIIVRLHETLGRQLDCALPQFLLAEVTAVEAVSTTEQPLQPQRRKDFSLSPYSMLTLRLRGCDVALDAHHVPHATPLIHKPCAACGERTDMMYLLWPKCTDGAFDHYELHRSLSDVFTPDEQTFVANVSNEEFVVARYVDEGLTADTQYFYRYYAVDKNGNRMIVSDVFSGWTAQA